MILVGGIVERSSRPDSDDGPTGRTCARRSTARGRAGAAGTEEGFTLLEVLVALTILGLGVVTLLQLSSQSLRLMKSSSDYQEAALLADRIASQTQVTSELADSGQEGLFSWERRIAEVALPDELKSKQTVPGQEDPKLFSVTIDVRWGQNKVVELATLRTPTTIPGQPVQGAPAGQPTTVPTPTPAPTQPGVSTPRRP